MDQPGKVVKPAHVSWTEKIYQVTQLRTDGVHYREFAGQYVVLKV